MLYWHVVVTCTPLTFFVYTLRRLWIAEAKCEKLQRRFDEMAVESKQLAADGAVKPQAAGVPKH